MSTLLAIVQKEFREIWRDPYTLGVVIFLPLVFLFMFGYALNLDVENIPLAVVDLDNSPEGREFIDAIVNTGKFDLRYRPTDPKEGGRLLDQGKVQAVVMIPSGFSHRLLGGEAAHVQTLIDGSFPTSARVIQGYLDMTTASYTAGLLNDDFAGPELQVGGLMSPAVTAVPRVLYNPDLESVNFIIPGLIAVILMAFPPLLSALAIVREKERGSVHQIFISPLRPWVFIVGKLVPYVAISFGELLLILLAARYWFGVPLAGNVWLFIVASIPYVLGTVAFGLLVSTLVSSQLAAMLAVIFLTMMPAFIFTGFLYSLANMPPLLQAYSHVFPGRYYTAIIRGVFLRGVGPEVWGGQLGSLMLYLLVLVTLASLRFKKRVG
jgi:ABC-2 type transport system permease protein